MFKIDVIKLSSLLSYTINLFQIHRVGSDGQVNERVPREYLGIDRLNVGA
jgi:hypothetical protein